MAGRAQVNLCFPPLGKDYPFINHARSASYIWRANGATEDHYALLDAQGYPTRMAAGASDYRVPTDLYVPDDPTERWVLAWDGSGSLGLSGNPLPSGMTLSTSDASSSGRREYVIDYGASPAGTQIPAIIQITAITAGNPPNNIRLYRKSYETRLTNGEMFNPHFLDRYSEWGCIRFMDWQYTNNDPNALWANRTKADHLSLIGAQLQRDAYCGLCTVSGNDYTAPNALSGDPTAWTDKMTIQVSVPSPPVSKTVTAATNANPAVLTVTGHGYATGDKVAFTNVSGGQWSWRLGGYSQSDTFNAVQDFAWKAWTITVIDANTFSLDGVDSTAFGTFTSAKVWKQPRAKAGSLPFKPVVFSNFDGLFTTAPSSSTPVWTLTYDADFDVLTYHPGATELSGRSNGVPLEAMVQLANELNVSPWFCIPHMADDDYVTQFATYVRDNLNAGLVARFEYSNEIWNNANGFFQTGYAQRKAGKKWGLAGYSAIYQWYGYRWQQVMSLITTVFAGQLDRIKRVNAMWTAASDTTTITRRITAPNATGGLSASASYALCDTIAIAPYCEPLRSNTANAQYVWGYNYGDATQKQEALDWLSAKWRADDGSGAWTVDYIKATLFPTWMTALATLNTAAGKTITLCQYEGGFGGIPSVNPLTASSYNSQSLTSTDVANFFGGLYNTSDYGRFTTELLNSFIDQGGEFPSQFCLVTGWGTGGLWAMIQPNIFGTPVPAYDDLQTFNAGKRRFRVT